MRSPRLLTSVAGATAVLALVAACGGGADDPTISTSPNPSSSVTSPSASPASPSASATPSPTPTVAPSNNLNAITVEGAYGKTPKVEFKPPFAIDQTRTKVLQASNGATVKDGQSVTVNYYGVNARTGKKFDDSFSRGEAITFPLDQVVPGFKKGLVGQKQGSRVLIAMPGPDGYDASGGNAQAGINVGDTLLFVVDLVGVQLEGPSGAAVTPKAGLPTVTDAAGVPTVTIPKTAAPKDVVVQPLIKGTGPAVKATDSVTFNYRWYSWSGTKLADTYESKQPATSGLSTLLTGVQKGLTGQTVGSRVMIIVPNAYPNGNEDPKINKGEAVVFVFDILFTQAATGQ